MDLEKIYTFLSLFAIIFLVYKIILSSKPKNKNLPPSPPSIPIWGHLHLLKPPFHRTLQSLSKRYGPIFSLRLGCLPVLVVSSPWAAEECFTLNDVVFANRPKFIVGEQLWYNHSVIVWSPYGDHWRNLRRVASITMLSFRRINEAGPTRKLEIHNMISELVASSEGGASKVNLNGILSKLARNFVMRVVNGKAWEKMIMTPPPILMTICDFLPILRWVGFKGIEKEMKTMMKDRDGFLQSLVDECRENRRRMSCDEQAVKKTYLIEQLLDLQEAEPDCYTDDIIKGMILTMLLAGSETTARTLEWAMANLINHPEVLAKARAEIDHSAGKGRLVDDSDLPKLSYIRCVINETLRLFPPAPLLVPHYSSEECSVGGFHVAKGTILFVNAWALQRDPNVWDEPDVFKPERFEKEKEGSKFMPFGIGRRSCPGNNFALRNVILAIATLIQCFDWEATTESGLVDLAEKNDGGAIIVPKEKPLEAICRPRSFVEDVLVQS